MYSYNDRVSRSSARTRALSGVTVNATLYNLDGTQKWTQAATVDVTRDKATVAFKVPEPGGLSTTYFLKLTASSSGKIVSDNFYWLSTKPDEMDWQKTAGTATTPQSAYADMTALQSLPPVTLRVQTKPAASPCATPLCGASRGRARPLRLSVRIECDGGFLYQQLTVSNPTRRSPSWCTCGWCSLTAKMSCPHSLTTTSSRSCRENHE